MLLAAEDVARPADLQVAHSDFKAGAKLGKFADGGEALLGNI